MAEVHGELDDRFAPVAEWLSQSVDKGGDVGAAVAATVDGEQVVDIWAGARDAEGSPWERDTLVIVASTTKGLTGLCGNMCVDRGLLDPDAPVAEYWPEFAAGGKDHVPVRYLFDHRVGLPDLPGMGFEQMGNWDLVCGALAAATPQWEPGTAHSYHSGTYGWLVGELVRRVSGRRPSVFLREEVCEPLGVEAWIGAPEEVDDRIAEIANADGSTQPLGIAALRRMEFPAGNAFTNARSLARIYAALACGGDLDGVHLLDRATIEDATSYEVTGPWFGTEDPAPILSTVRFARGWVLNSLGAPMGPNPRAFGYAGAGGSIGWADPDRHVSLGYTPNLFDTTADGQPVRATQLAEVLFSCV